MQRREVPPPPPPPADAAEYRARLRAAAERALAEARERRAQQRAAAACSEGAVAPLRELGGPRGPEPTRYGDWERNGVVSDF